jgi:uncharacterized protein YdeI (YjbR/CyaY-like superfamily)
MDIKDIKYFKNVKEFRTWLKKNHNTEKELWAGFYKKSSGRISVSYPEAVDTALCFGWIDGIRKSVDELSYTNRFTPRNPNSNWSAVNIKKVEELKKLGLMEPAGMAVYAKRREDKSEVERTTVELGEKYRKIFKKNIKAWKYFNTETPSYKKITILWIMSAKREETRMKRLEVIISNSENGERIPLLRRNA